MEKIHIVLSTDENYVKYAGVMITSLLYNKKSSNPVLFHILIDNLSSQNRFMLEEIIKSYDATVFFWNVNPKKIEGLVLLEYISNATYFRLLSPYILPAEIEKVLYLDVDIIIRKDITALWKIDIKDYCIAAVEDFWCNYKYPEENPAHMLKLGIPKSEPYFNAGVLLINLIKWREDDIGLKILEFVRNNSEKIIFSDQDGLNAMLWGKWFHLKHEWNVMSYEVHSVYRRLKNNLLPEIIESVKDPAIIHFTGGGSSKPWEYKCQCINPYAKEYCRYLKMTPWAEDIPKANSLQDIWKNYSRAVKYKIRRCFEELT